MVSLPLALLLGLGAWISFTRGKGKGAAWFGFLCVTLGIVIANTSIGRALTDVVQSAVTAAVAAGQGVTGR